MESIDWLLEQILAFTFHSGTILIEVETAITTVLTAFTFHSGTILIRV